MPPLGGRPRKLVKAKPKPGMVTFAKPVKPKTLTQITTKAQRADYARKPVAQRQQILASPKVKQLAPTYHHVIQVEHTHRIKQLKSDPAARQRLVKRQLGQALERAAHPHQLTHVQPKGGATGLAAIDAATRLAGKAAPSVAAAAFPAASSALAGLDKLTGSKTLKAAKTVVSSAPADAAELAVTTPSSIAKLATTAVHHPGKVPGMLADPYVHLYRHPGWALTHPVSTALMLAPAARAPGLAAGRVARLAGKQTLERPAAVFAGTPVREARTGSRDILVRHLQARKDAKTGPPQIAATVSRPAVERLPPTTRQFVKKIAPGTSELERHVDEFFDVTRQEAARNRARTRKSEKYKTKGQPRAERKAHIEARVAGSDSQLRGRQKTAFARQFGSTAQVTPEGVVLHVKPAPHQEGTIFESRADAEKVRDSKRLPFEGVVKDLDGGKFAVVPKVANDRLNKHYTVGTSEASGAVLMRGANRTFRGAVLPTSMKWLAGQAIEATGRATLAGASPVSFLRERRIYHRLEKIKPGAGDDMRARAVQGGHFGSQSPTRELLHENGPGSDELPDPELHAAVEDAHTPAHVGRVRRGWHAYTRVVFDQVNGKIESTARKAMLGKAIKQSPLMERHLLSLTDKAISEAAHGLTSTEHRVALAREVDRMYGKYGKFSPRTRETLLHSTPFYPWYRNVVTFLLKTLPVDHPLKAGLLASLDATTEDWRKAHGLSLRGGSRRPDFLFGGIPTGAGDQVIRVGRYLPFAPKDVTGAVADLALPQFAGIRDAARGIDFKGGKLKGNHLVRALVTAVETHVPGTAQTDRILGLSEHYGDKKGPSVFQGKKVLPALSREFNPAAPTKPKPAKTKKAGSGWGTGGSSKKSGWG